MKRINGTIYSYSFLCWRKVWFFYHNITMEQNNENVIIGKEIDETSYARDKKHIMVDGAINIDYVRDGIVYEIKKSSKQKEMAINQIKFYLYTLKTNGIVEPKGMLCIPEEKYKEEVLLDVCDIDQITKRMEEIKGVIASDTVPTAINIKACKSCSYFDLCFI